MRRIGATLRWAALACLLAGIAAPVRAEESYAEAVARGARQVRARNLPKALEAFADAARIDPTAIDAYFNAGSVAERLRKCRETLLYFRGFLFLSPGTSDDRQAKAAVASCESKPGVGTLTVKTEPKGIEVSLDGLLQARTPVAQVKIPVGTYRVGLSCRCPDFDDAVREVTIVEGRDTEVEVTLTRKLTYGWLQVETDPKEGVKVYLDEKLVGETPIAKVRLETTKHFLRLEKAGYDPWVRNVQVERDKTKVVQATMEAIIPEPTDAARPRTVQ